TRRFYQDDPRHVQQIDQLLEELHEEFGRQSRHAAPIVGRYLYRKLLKQQERLKAGWTYEPPTFFETNFADGPAGSKLVRSVLASPDSPTVEPNEVADIERLVLS
ncbi:MAG: hypothetical protein ACR2NU_07465, partial [Aeoliella sp.]